MYITFCCNVINNEDIQDDLVAGRDAVGRAANSTFWKWKFGSRPFFWHWPLFYCKRIRDGVEIMIEGKLPSNRKNQPRIEDPQRYQKIGEIFHKVRKLQYVQPGPVKSLISVFDVPKEDDDIRLVYNRTSCGLNKVVVTP